jgi:NAD(P)H-dependent flavin oxidoreductase YrpB (nitropropane dioxygenase family)
MVVKSVIKAGFNSVIRSTVWTGRPLRAFSTPYIANWEENRQAEIKYLTSRGMLPVEHDLGKLEKEGKMTEQIEEQSVMWYGNMPVITVIYRCSR